MFPLRSRQAQLILRGCGQAVGLCAKRVKGRRLEPCGSTGKAVSGYMILCSDWFLLQRIVATLNVGFWLDVSGGKLGSEPLALFDDLLSVTVPVRSRGAGCQWQIRVP